MILKGIPWAMKASHIPIAVSKLATATAAPILNASPLHPATIVATIRGGAKAAVLDMDRVTLRLDGLDSYAVLAAIVLGAAMDVYGSVEARKYSLRRERIARHVHGFGVLTSVLSSVYVVMVFSLFNFYAKTAIGIGADNVYFKLLDATSRMRVHGFEAFLLSLVGFEFALIANIFLNSKGRARWVFSILCAIGTAFSIKDWGFVVRCATKYIFK